MRFSSRVFMPAPASAQSAPPRAPPWRALVGPSRETECSRKRASGRLAPGTNSKVIIALSLLISRTLSEQRLLHFRRCQRQVAQTQARGIGERVGDGGGGGTHTGLAGTEERSAGAVDDMHIDAIGHVVEPDDGVTAPIPAGDLRLGVVNRFVERPAGGLHDAALDLVFDAVGADGIAAVDRGDGAYHADLAGIG